MLLHLGALASGMTAFGDVFVGRHPAAVGQGAVDDQGQPAVGRSDFVADAAALGQRGLKLTAVTVGIARKGAVGDTVVEQAGERNARPRNLRRQLIHGAIARVADQQPFLLVEHAQTL
jgi:hypothetical protein